MTAPLENADPLNRAFRARPSTPPFPGALPPRSPQDEPVRRQAGIEAAPAALSTSSAAGLDRQTSATPNASLNRERSITRALFLGALIPAILLIVCVSKYGVNVSYGDEWLMIPLLAKYHDHQLTWADLYQQHNEHRIVIPKLIYLAFSRFDHWNLHAEMYFSIAICLATSAALYYLLRLTLSVSQRQRLLLWIGCNLFIFSPTQAENWLWGFQLQMFIPNLCLVLALLALNSDRNWPVRFSLAAVATLTATFSFGNGLMLWPAVGLCLLLRRERISHLISWIALAAVVVTVYFIGYVSAPKSRPVDGTWLDYPSYFLFFLGATLTRDGLFLKVVTTALGALGLFGLVTTHLLRCSKETLLRAAPWIAIGGYAIASAALAAITRVHCGPGQAADSRYITISQNLYIALLVLFVLPGTTADFESLTLGKWLHSAKTAIVTSIMLLLVMSFPAGLTHMQVLQRFVGTGLAALQFSQAIDTKDLLGHQLLLPVQITDPGEYISLLERMGFLDRRQLGADGSVKDGEDRPARATTEFGATNQVRSSDAQHLEMKGWAFLPDRGVPAPAVILAYRDGGRWRPFEICKTGESRRDIAARLHNREYLTTGWSRTFSRDKLPEGAEFVSAWAVDPFSAKTYKLPIDFRLPK